MTRSEMKKKAQIVLHGKYGNWSLIVLVPLIVGVAFFLISFFFPVGSTIEYEDSQYRSWQERNLDEENGDSYGATEDQNFEAYEKGFVDGYSEGYDDGWDDSLMEENGYEKEPEKNQYKKLNTLFHSLQPLSSPKEVNRTIAHRYKDNVNSNHYNIGGVIYAIVSLSFTLFMVLYGGMSTWAAVDSINGLPFSLKTVFDDFIRKNGKKVAIANVWVTLYTLLWSFLFVIPGIVKGASYSMTNYLMKKDDQLSAKEAIVLSQKLMMGYKIEYLILKISFVFWSYANILSLGFASFYVTPYCSVTEVFFFEQIIQAKRHLFTEEREAGFDDF